MCNAFGHEAMVSHRSYRRLAQHLAAEGFAVLRFDYDGTGDSAGEDSDPNRVDAWLDSIRRACSEAIALSGAEHTILFGMRLGALLALAQAERAPVDGLMLLAPPRSGRAWLREMRALQAIKGARSELDSDVSSDPGIAGFLLDHSTRADLERLDAAKVRTCPARNAFIIARDDLPGAEAILVDQLGRLGLAAELCATPGYAASMPEDPFKSVVPVQLFDDIAAWLKKNYEATAGAEEPPAISRSAPTSSRPSFTTMSAPTPLTRERVVDLGGLFGILSEPALPSSQTRTAILLLNIGANHHIGSNRMYVRMARAWAAEGFHVLRMDFSGMGDSPAVNGGKENDVYATRFMLEARSGIDFLQTQGATNFVLMGLCSGAYVAYHTAIADPRVSGVVMINPLTFHWREGDSLEIRLRQSFKSTELYKKSFFRAETWRRIAHGDVAVAAIARELARRTRRRAQREVTAVLARLTGEIAEATDIHRGFRQLCNRGTECLLVFGSEDGGIDLIEEHLGQDAIAMRKVPGFRMEVMEGPDHTFTPLWTQSRLQELVGAFLTGLYI
jgi:pimeloyl-ACP methyl ester carboxylesterase